MASGTLPRGRGDTPSAFRVALAVAAIAHLPFVPSDLSGLLERVMRDPPADDAPTIVPIDLDLLHEPPKTPSPEPPPRIAAPEPATSGSVAKAPHPPRAKALSSGDAPARASASAPPPAALRDPIAVAESVGQLASKQANVQVLLAGDRLRKHDLAMNFASLLVNVPEWRGFFEGTGVDPLRDFDHLLVAGPRFRGDSSHVVAIMEHRLSDEAARAAIEVVVKRGGGAWLEETVVPAARVKAAGRERIIAFVPGKHLLAILPADAKDDLEALTKSRGFNRSSTAGIVVSMVTPARPMAEVLELPSWLAWMRLSFTPGADRGGELRIEFGDRSAEDAARDAPTIRANYDRARSIQLPFVGSVEALDAAEFSTEGAVIRAHVKVTEMQLRRVLAFAGTKYGKPEAVAPASK